MSQQNIQRIKAREEDGKVLQQDVQAINLSVDKAIKDSEQIFTQLSYLMEKRCPSVKLQETAMSRVKKCQEELPLTVKIQPIQTFIQYNFLYSELLSV